METDAGARTATTGRDGADTRQELLVASTRLRRRTSTRNRETPSGSDTRADQAALPRTDVCASRFHPRPTLCNTTTSAPLGALATRPRTVVALADAADALASTINCTGFVDAPPDGLGVRVGVPVGGLVGVAVDDFDPVLVGVAVLVWLGVGVAVLVEV